ncbi:MAG: FAD-dependent oxidoreductase, partial [Pseudohongiellaceae bacterium]
TTGYEEAAAQGLLAGINAALAVKQQDPWTPGRELAYMGVMVDDLITRGTMEPYRMFTSRAEYRLILRQDNADLRLTGIGRKLGLVDDERWQSFCNKREQIEQARSFLQDNWVQPGTELAQEINRLLEKPISHEYRFAEILARPGVTLSGVYQACEASGMALEPVAPAVAEQAEIDIKYQGYINRQQKEIEKLKRQENSPLPADFDYSRIPGLSNELRQKLSQARPDSIARAARIPGVTPAAVSLLLVYLKKYHATGSGQQARSSKIA